MPDIFGLEPQDYSHYQDLPDGTLDSYLRANAAADQAATGVPRQPHNFNALGGATHHAFESETQAVGYVTNNLQAIQAFIDETLYTEYRLPEYIPIVTNIPENVRSYAFRVTDKVGRGEFISARGQDAPTAGVAQRLVPYTVQYGGINPEWTLEDVRHSMRAGVSLEQETMEAATTGAKDHIELVGLFGDARFSFRGLLTLDGNGLTGMTVAASDQPVRTSFQSVLASAGISNSGVTKLAHLDGDSMVAFLQHLMIQHIQDSKEIFGRNLKMGMCLYMPIEEAGVVMHTRLKELETTVWKYFLANNMWTKYTGRKPMLKILLEASDAGHTGTGGYDFQGNATTIVAPRAVSGTKSTRMICALNHKRVWEMAMPISPRVIKTLDKAYTVCAPMEYKISGVNLKRPGAVRYIDGI